MSRVIFLVSTASLLFGCAGLPYGRTPSLTSASTTPTLSPEAAVPAAPAAAAPTAAPAAKADDLGDDGACKGDVCVRRCEAKGRVKDCEAAGAALVAGDGVKADDARAAKALQKACELKSRASCFNLATLLEDSKTVSHDLPKALSLYAAACELGRGDACQTAATRLEEGDGVAKDHKKAVGLLAKGCIADDYSATACSDFRDVAKKRDTEAAKTLRGWKSACAKKDAASCAGVERTSKDAL